MLHFLLHAFTHGLMITAFVFMMMVIIEYINIRLKGRLMTKMTAYPAGQSTVGSFLGIIPGCLGSFTNVALYQHGVLSFGALVAGMIATSGDEAFVMISLFPVKFLILTVCLFVIGLLVGIVVDRFFLKQFGRPKGVLCDELVVHELQDEPQARGYIEQVVYNLGRGEFIRWAMLVVLLSFGVLVAAGIIVDEHSLWMRFALIALCGVCIWITIFGTDHFLEEHVWRHVIKKHMPTVFLWTFGVLFAFEILSQYMDIPFFVQQNKYLMLMAACLLGIIPESGPHFIFVMLFAEGALPFSILLASSIVQDGHGMLPLLAFSRRDFLVVKLINFIVGLLLGGILLLFGI